ncbi:MAG: VanZ family protein [Rectinema sp.]|nr:VanZ family protein [Rectinema sp.]
MKIITHYKWTILSAALVLTILLLPSALFLKMPSRSLLNDKTVHAILFGFMTAVFSLEYRHWKKLHAPLIPTFLAISAFAYLTEIAQSVTPSRHYDLRDFLADLVGIAVGIMAVRVVCYLLNLRVQGSRE